MCGGGSQRTAGGGARQLAPHLVAPPHPFSLHIHRHAYLFHVTLWARLARCWRGVRRWGPNQGFNQYTSLVKDRPTAAVANSPPTAYGAVLISGLTGLAP